MGLCRIGIVALRATSFSGANVDVDVRMIEVSWRCSKPASKVPDFASRSMALYIEALASYD